MRILGYYQYCVAFIIILHSWLEIKRNGNSAPSLRFLFCTEEKKNRRELKSAREQDCAGERERERGGMKWKLARAVITVARITGIRACAYRGTLPVEWLWHQKISHEKHLRFTSVISVILLQGLSILKLRHHCLCVRCNFPCFPLRDWSEMEATATGVFSPRIAASGCLSFLPALFSFPLVIVPFQKRSQPASVKLYDFRPGEELRWNHISLKYYRDAFHLREQLRAMISHGHIIWIK